MRQELHDLDNVERSFQQGVFGICVLVGFHVCPADYKTRSRVSVFLLRFGRVFVASLQVLVPIRPRGPRQIILQVIQKGVPPSA